MGEAAVIWGRLTESFWLNCQLFGLTLLFAIPLGLVVAFGSMSRFAPLRGVVKTFVWAIRGTPLMLQILVIYLGPGLMGFTNPWPSGGSGRLVAAVVAFAINYACYFSEIYRGGIEAVPKGQTEAGQVLGMTRSQIFFKVTLLQVVKRILPPMGNEIITLVKDTSLANVIANKDIIMMAKEYSAKGLIWPLFSTAVFFLVFVGVLTLFFGWLEKRLDYFREGGTAMALLEVAGIGKSFGSTAVLRDISFELQKGEALAIIGSSGSGKTTLLRCLNFLETADTGSITVAGETLWSADDARTQSEAVLRKKRLHFGLVFQNFNLFPQYTALQNVMLAGELLAKERLDYKQNRKQIHDELETHARELLAQMGLSDRAGHYPHQLSGGQQQRVAIARALALHPDILCFDEPTSALDPELTGEVLRVLRDLAEHKTTMIIVTHEMKFARDVADRILFMDGGVVVEQGDAKQVIDHPQEERTRKFLASYGK